MAGSSQCYCKGSSQISSSCGEAQPCASPKGGRVVTCCGVNAVCGMDGFCYDNHSDTRAVDGYYMGGCTDPTFTDVACPQYCTDLPNPDVVYNAETGLWYCCYGITGLNCSSPSSESFAAKGPAFLFGTRTAMNSSSVNTTTTKNSQIVASPTLSETPSPSTTVLQPTVSTTAGQDPDIIQSMSNQVSLGVGLGVGVPSLLCAIATLYLGFRKFQRRSRRQSLERLVPIEHQRSRYLDGEPNSAMNSHNRQHFNI